MNIDKLIINPGKSIKEALKQLDLGAEKILFVVDEEGKLLGTLTDGDIRRYILKDGSLQDAVDNCFNRNPVFTETGYDSEVVKSQMLKYKKDVIPVIDESRKLVDFITWGQIFCGTTQKKEQIELPVVIMSGGKGTRLDPFTKILPKPLIPIGDKPIIEHIMDRFHEHGITEFYLSVNYKGEMIRAYFDNANTNFTIHYLWEKDFLGTAGSLSLMPKDAGKTFMVSNCDIIVEADYADLLKFHIHNRYALTIVGSIQHYRIPYGILEYETGGTLKRITEKPEFDIVVNTGLYVVESDVLGLIPSDRMFHMTDLIDALLKENRPVGVYPVSEKSYIDIGQWEEYRKNLEKFITD